MPIDIDRFEEKEPLGRPATSGRVLALLLANDDRAYTRREIADAVGASPETVGTNLSRLKRRGLVRHNEPYWAITEDREAAVSTLRERYGTASPEELVAAGEPDQSPAGDAPATAEGADDAGAGGPQSGRVGRSHREAARAFLERVRDRLGDEVTELRLFGSVVRGETTADSDVDVLAVVTDDADYAAVDEELLAIAYEVQLAHEVRVEVHSLRASEFAARRERGDPFVHAVLGESGADDG